MQACRDNLGIVENHYGTGGKEIRNVTENEFVHDTVTIAQQFGRIALREGICGYPFIRKGLVLVFYTYIRYHREIFKSDANLHNMAQILKGRRGNSRGLFCRFVY